MFDPELKAPKTSWFLVPWKYQPLHFRWPASLIFWCLLKPGTSTTETIPAINSLTHWLCDKMTGICRWRFVINQIQLIYQIDEQNFSIGLGSSAQNRSWTKAYLSYFVTRLQWNDTFWKSKTEKTFWIRVFFLHSKRWHVLWENEYECGS